VERDLSRLAQHDAAPFARPELKAGAVTRAFSSLVSM
jgi:hypothetical protein